MLTDHMSKVTCCECTTAARRIPETAPHKSNNSAHVSQQGICPHVDADSKRFPFDNFKHCFNPLFKRLSARTWYSGIRSLVPTGSRVGPRSDSVALPPVPTSRTLTLKLFRRVFIDLEIRGWTVLQGQRPPLSCQHTILASVRDLYRHPAVAIAQHNHGITVLVQRDNQLLLELDGKHLLYIKIK
jgi:hypothetical protein